MRGTSPQTPRTTETDKRLGLALDRLSGLRRVSARRGFTIVELLIVVVVLAILAAIVLVSYNGITNQANDSARLADASTIEKAIQLHQAEHGWSTGVNDIPETREGVLAIFGLEGVANRVYILHLDGEGGPEFDRSKVYVQIELHCEGVNSGSGCSVPWTVAIGYAYWSNAHNTWHNVEQGNGRDGVYRYTTTAEDGPFSVGDNSPV